MEQLEDEAQGYRRKLAEMKQEFTTLLVGKEFSKTRDIATQCDAPSSDGSRTRWLYLLSLKIFMLTYQELLEPGSAAQVLAPETVSRAMQCGPDTAEGTTQTMVMPIQTTSEEDQWWRSTASQSEQLWLKFSSKKSRKEGLIDGAAFRCDEAQGVAAVDSDSAASKPPFLSEKAVLELISAIYEEKAIADYLCRQQNREREPLSLFAFAFFLSEEGDRETALHTMTSFVASLLRYVRIDARSGGPMVPSARHRMVLFARFLQFDATSDTGGKLSGISTRGLELYLVMLACARQGRCPLLECGMSRMKAAPEVLESVVDQFFSSQESWRCLHVQRIPLPGPAPHALTQQ